MQVLGLILGTVFYLVDMILLFAYLGLAVSRKYNSANRLLPFIFVHSMLSIAFISWSLVIMNSGFGIEFENRAYYMPNGFSLLFIGIVPLLLIYLVADYKVRRNTNRYKITSPMRLYRWLLPGITICIFLICTFVFYFECHYFEYLQNYSDYLRLMNPIH